jgi:ferredoxin-NADP reductase
MLSHDTVDGYEHGFITENFLRSQITDYGNNVYLCGPPPMMEAVEKHLLKLNVDKKLIIKEEF